MDIQCFMVVLVASLHTLDEYFYVVIGKQSFEFIYKHISIIIANINIIQIS